MGRWSAISVVAAALCLAALPAAHAAGLGKLTVLSALGQPLNAEVEIVALQPGEEDGLVARLGSPEAFKGSGIEFSAALNSVRGERRDRSSEGRSTFGGAGVSGWVDMVSGPPRGATPRRGRACPGR